MADIGISVFQVAPHAGAWIETCRGHRGSHPYQIFLEQNDMEHRKAKVANPGTNGFIERFNRTILDEFFRETF